MNKKAIVLTALALALFATPTLAKSTSVGKHLNMQPAVQHSENVVSSTSWAYKTLTQLYKKHGLLLDIPKAKFDGTQPLTRNEAALILVNLVGKIQNEKIDLSEIDQERLYALSDQFKNDINKLTMRLSFVEEDVESLQGEVSELDAKVDKKWTSFFGGKHKLGGSTALGYSHSNYTTDDSSAFSMPYANMFLTGEVTKDIDYFMMMDFNYDKYEWTGNDLVERLFVTSDIIPHHKIKLGKMPVPISVEGTNFYASLDTASYFAPSTLKMGYERELGATITGDYKYFDYTAGVFNEEGSNDVTIAENTSTGVGLLAKATIKPFAGHEKLGKLKLGTSYYTAKDDYQVNQTYAINTGGVYLPVMSGNVTNIGNTDSISAYLNYKLNKFELTSEYIQKSNAIDFNNYAKGVTYLGDASGYFVRGTYYITPKLQLVAMLDDYDNGINYKTQKTLTAGANYYLKYPNVKLQGMYQRVNGNDSVNSNRFVLQTSFAF